MSTLIVTLPSGPPDPASPCDYVLSPDGQTLAAQSSAPPALLPAPGPGGEVVALVPPQQLSWHQVQLPRGTLGQTWWRDAGNTRLRAVLDGLLEERLLDEPAQLHLALEPHPRAENAVWVAACDRAWLHGAQQTLAQAGHAVSRIVPEFTPQMPADTLYVLGEAPQARLVFTRGGAVTSWPLSAASVALLNWPDNQPIVAEPAVAALAERLFRRSVTLQQVAQRRLQALQSPWNLAQFDLAHAGRTRRLKQLQEALSNVARAPRWRAARLALLALLLVNLAGLNAWAWKARSQLTAQHLAIHELLTSTFPQVQVVVDAPLQMARELAALQQANGTPAGRDLEPMLAALAAATPALPVPQHLDFGAGELRLGTTPLPPEAMDTLNLTLRPQGYTARADGAQLVVTAVAAP